jgi:hypothetical protein
MLNHLVSGCFREHAEGRARETWDCLMGRTNGCLCLSTQGDLSSVGAIHNLAYVREVARVSLLLMDWELQLLLALVFPRSPMDFASLAELNVLIDSSLDVDWNSILSMVSSCPDHCQDA